MPGDLRLLRQGAQPRQRPALLVRNQAGHLQRIIVAVDLGGVVLRIEGIEGERLGDGAGGIGRRQPVRIEQQACTRSFQRDIAHSTRSTASPSCRLQPVSMVSAPSDRPRLSISRRSSCRKAGRCSSRRIWQARVSSAELPGASGSLARPVSMPGKVRGTSSTRVRCSSDEADDAGHDDEMDAPRDLVATEQRRQQPATAPASTAQDPMPPPARPASARTT